MTVIDRLAVMKRRVREARGWQRAALAFAAGAVSDLAMAPFFVAPVLFVTLPVLVWLIDEAEHDASPLAAAARQGWWFGFGYFFLGLFWIGEAFLVEADKFGWALPFAVTLMPAGLALFWGGAAALARAFWRPGLARVLVLALAFGVAEWLRGHVLTGFPWNVIGYALTWPLVMMQSAGLLGVYGLTLIAVLVFGAPLVLLADAAPGEGRTRAGRASLLIVAGPLALLLCYGSLRLLTAPTEMVSGVRLRIVQPSVPQADKWRPEKQGEIFRDHLNLSRQAPDGRRDDLSGVTHVIWAEAAMPFLPLEHPEALDAIGDLLPAATQLVTGALRREARAPDAPPDQMVHAYNSLMVFGDDGALTATYDKTHLVPFGEYLPMQATLEALGFEQLTRVRGGFSIGPTPRPLLAVRGLPPAGGLICYEAIFPGVGAQSAGRPGIFLNVTNDGWFGNTTGPRQHFHQARVRAVEEGVPLIRAANNGISAVVDASGRVLFMLGINVRGTIDSGVPVARSAPPYAVAGDSIFLLTGLLFAATILFLGKSGGRTTADQ
jgi:apolipoprotein N-acyltransferase